MQNIINSLKNPSSKLSKINMTLVCLSLCCTSAHGAIAPWVKDEVGYHNTVYPFLEKHPLVLDNLKEIRHVHYQKYKLIYTYTTMFNEKKICTAEFGSTFMFKPYIKFFGSDCPISETQDEEDFFF